MTSGEKNHEIINVHVGAASRAYDVLVGPGALALLGEVTRSVAGDARVCVVSETNVAPLYADAAEASLSAAGMGVAPRIVFPAGEAHKGLGTLGGILEGLAERGLTRDDVVVALGGGVTGDMTGLAAALYLRGIRVVQAPTSLLAMVDSSVGGKTAVDIAAGKNLVGAFWQPSAVVADVSCLETVSPELLTDSCGEVVKHAVLADGELLDRLTVSPLNAPGASADEVAAIVARNIEIKRDVVEADERERGLRQTLNLGHTVGHAIEAASDFALGHGTCVAAGLCIVARASETRGWCSGETRRRIERCVRAHGLPVTTDLPADVLMGFLAHDKKRHGDGVNLVVPAEVGRAEVRRVSLAGMRELLDAGLEMTGAAS